MICFFFKILPQLLYYLDVEKNTGEDSIDWGTLIVYSCENSCSLVENEIVKEEYLWRQLGDKM